LTLIARFDQHRQLFKNHDLTRNIIVEINNGEKLGLKIWYEKGKINIKLNDFIIPWDLKTIPSGPLQQVKSSLQQASRAKLLIEARLYGYDRYGLASSSCVAPTVCGFHLRLKGLQPRPVPKNILSELGWNANITIKMVQDVVIQLNNLLTEYLDEKIEIKVLMSGNIAIFDYHFEVDSLGVSDSIFRVLYYLIAIKTAMNYVKLYGLEKKFILLLEEPEAHVFPYYLDMLSDYIAKAKEFLYIIIATHNPILVSMLWDKIREVKTYYVARDAHGSTKVWEVNIERLAKELKTAEDLLSMPPREILSEYIAGINHAGYTEQETK
jgi:hypothetical protein